ncbi:fatty-acid amide hydrolase 1-like [Pecten maximus]|uniref:fatty-acid amide hydrolase 1-like n=1 Tax=Pecten maximus TaxID=6579 RepID=UPI0014589CFD|nr:fatty-acid amide hydrolase 1-like [Pecten maximus]XP_033761933.1 fatty-acid amide hydrolase 1-like [Pecten maximus]
MDKFKLSWPSCRLEVPEPIRKNVSFVLTVTTTCVIGAVIIRKFTKSRNLNRRIKEKRDSCREACRKLGEQLEQNGLTLAERTAILELSFEDLRQKLQNGDLQCIDVLHAYQSKAIQVNEHLNCVVEPIWEAEALALERDMSTRKKGPLHGIPISVKENYCLEGYDCTGGMSSFLDLCVTEENTLIKVLKKQGAIPFVRTNIPQSMMTYECSNPIYGVTKNPHDLTRGPGGSSGGEGALIAAKGSVLGFGTDIGGSIRIPSHFSGVYGLKPTVGRLSEENLLPFIRGQPLVNATGGPLASDVDGLVAAMKSLLVPAMFDQDPTCPPIPFRNEIFESKRPLRIGFFLDNGYLTPVPACQRAVTKATEILQARGHTIVKFDAPNIEEYFELYLLSVFGDGGQSFKDVIKNDQIDSSLKLAYLNLTLPKWLSVFAGWIMSKFGRDPVMYIISKCMRGTGSVAEYWKTGERIKDFKKMMRKRWRANKLDVLLCPGFAYPAVHSGNVFNVLGGVSYTIIYNVLDYPAGSIPVTKVTAEDEAKMADYPNKTAYEKAIRKDNVGSKGLPVNVQCAGLPYQEELVLRVMKELEQGLKAPM